MNNNRSKIVQQIVDMLDGSDKAGLDKYGVTVDRPDLSAFAWLEHATQEMGDQLKYLFAFKREMERIYAVLKAAREALDGDTFDGPDDEIGERRCCGVLSYHDHAPGCPLVMIDALPELRSQTDKVVRRTFTVAIAPCGCVMGAQIVDELTTHEHRLEFQKRSTKLGHYCEVREYGHDELMAAMNMEPHGNGYRVKKDGCNHE